MTGEQRSRLRAILRAMKMAWGAESVELGTDSILVVVHPEHAMGIPATVEGVPVEILLITEEMEAA